MVLLVLLLRLVRSYSAFGDVLAVATLTTHVDEFRARNGPSTNSTKVPAGGTCVNVRSRLGAG